MSTVNGAANGNDSKLPLRGSKFVLRDTTVENLRPLRVVVVGAGYSGIVAAIRIPEKLRNIDLTVYEQNEGVGGVWWMNRYPGENDPPTGADKLNSKANIGVKVLLVIFHYTFEPNPRWSSLYAPGKEIQQYLEHVATKYGATRFIKTSHQVTRCEWLANEKKWKITVKNLKTGETIEDKANILLTARGQLNNVNWPNIPGLDTFKGKLLHSAEWDEDYDFRNQRVGVIGNGSSAIQIVPSLQKLEGVKLTTFTRSPTWISSAFGDAAMVELGLDPNCIDFTQEQREAFAADPEGYLKMRKVIEDGGNLIHDSTIPGTQMQKDFTELFRKSMSERLAKKPELLDTILPTFAPGCRRLTPGTGYLEALTEPNVEVVRDGIAAVTATGVRLSSGREVELDALACATGFQVSAPPPFEVVGRDGLTLARRWSPYPESYLSIAVDGFPNYLMMFGPNSAIGFGSLTKILEAETDYVVHVIRKLQKDDYAAVEPLPERVADFSEYVDRYFENTVYMDKCKSWYRSEGGYGDRICGLWPGSTLHALEALRSPRWEDFAWERAEGAKNALEWLGNGWSETQKNGDMSWYINPNEVEIPHEGKPEENPRYLARPWSY